MATTNLPGFWQPIQPKVPTKTFQTDFENRNSSAATVFLQKYLPGVIAIRESLGENSITPLNKFFAEKNRATFPQESDTPEQRAQKIINIGSGTLNFASTGKSVASVIAPKVFDATKYVAENVAKQAAARTSESLGIIGNIRNFFATAKRSLVDSNAPIEDILASSLKKSKLSLLPSQDITNAIDRVYRAPTMASQFIRDNGLEGVIRGVDNLENLDQYLIAKQATAVDTRGFATGRNLADDEKLVAAFKDKYEPIARGVTEYSRKLLDYAVDSGLVSKELADRLKVIYPDYVPLNRIFSELEQEGSVFGTKAVANLSRQTIVQKLQGSTREIESPIASLMSKTYDAFLQGEKNKTAQMLADYHGLPGNPFQLEKIIPGGATKSEGTISFFRNGEKETWATTKDVAAAAKALNPQSLNILGRILAFPVRIARIGITGLNVPFIVRNVARDQVTAAINSRNALKTSIGNPAVYLSALFNAVGHGQLYQEAVRAGGMGTSFDIAREQIPKTIAGIRSTKSVPSRIAHLVTTPSQLFRAVEDIVSRAEEFTRIKQYAGTKDAILAKGLPPEEAIAAAARAAREDTVNFMRRGDWGTVLNSAFLYLNAGIQGTRTLLRSLKTNPLSTATKIAITTFTPIAMSTAWNLSDPKRKEAYDDIADYEKQNNIIIVPPNPTKDDKGRWNVIKIPLSQEIQNMSNIPRRFMEQAHGLDPVKTQEVFSALLGSVEPINPTERGLTSSLVPQAVKPAIEGVTNQNFFTGIPIVPDSMKNLPPAYQVKPQTSGTARVLGGLTNTSPLKVENFIKSSAGGVGNQIINALDNVLATGGVIPKEQVGGESILAAIKRRSTQATGGEVERKLIKRIQVALSDQDVEKVQMQMKAEQKFAELKQLASTDKEAANKLFASLQESDKALAQAVYDVAQKDKIGLTASDRFIGQLNVTNGARAKFIYSMLADIKGKENRNAYVQNLVDKDLISANVYRQLRELITKNPI